MEQVIKTYLGIFLMMLLSTVGIGIVAAEAQICQARNFKSDVVVELENSNYNRESRLMNWAISCRLIYMRIPEL